MTTGQTTSPHNPLFSTSGIARTSPLLFILLITLYSGSRELYITVSVHGYTENAEGYIGAITACMHEETAWTLAEGDRHSSAHLDIYIRGGVYHCKKL